MYRKGLYVPNQRVVIVFEHPGTVSLSVRINFTADLIILDQELPKPALKTTKKKRNNDIPPNRAFLYRARRTVPGRTGKKIAFIFDLFFFSCSILIILLFFTFVFLYYYFFFLSFVCLCALVFSRWLVVWSRTLRMIFRRFFDSMYTLGVFFFSSFLFFFFALHLYALRFFF